MEKCTAMKIIIWGLGKDFQENERDIHELFDVVAYTDKNTELYASKPDFVLPENIGDFEFDKILICSRHFFEVIRLQIIKELKIPYMKVMGIEEVIKQKKSSEGFQDALRDIETYSLSGCQKFPICDDTIKIMENDRYDCAGNPKEHYFAQDIWGAKKVLSNNPKQHYDIGSSLNGFVAHLLVFRKVHYIDIRPLPYEIDNLYYVQGDAMNLEKIQDGTIESLSSFHALEHFGLGRYGDNIDVDGYIKAAYSMMRVLSRGGRLYLGVPVGPTDKLCFNAHRIFRIKTILELFDELELVDMAIVYPGEANAVSIAINEVDDIPEYSCGLFEFIKKEVVE